MIEEVLWLVLAIASVGTHVAVYKAGFDNGFEDGVNTAHWIRDKVEARRRLEELG